MEYQRLFLRSGIAALTILALTACAPAIDIAQQIRDALYGLPSQPTQTDALTTATPPQPEAIDNQDQESQPSAASDAAAQRVFFVSPVDSEVVTSPVHVEMGATGLTIEPAGEIAENAGHMHILVDEDFVAPGEVILASDTMLHYGGGQTEATLDLPPGEHTLRLQFANGAHIALDGDQYRDEITITVAEEEAQSPDAGSQSVFFVSPEDGVEVTSPLHVEMGATGLTIEPAGEIAENAGHMHILVDEDFVAPGEVILASDTMLHYGGGQTEATLDLAPGEHTLRLQFANGAHIALDGEQYRDEITVTVTGEDSTASHSHSEEDGSPAVFFISPTDGSVVNSPLHVEMGATGLSVDPAGDIKENSGHMHILVDEDFVAPGEVILASDTMLHYGGGQTEATLDLTPGEHTLRLQFADGAHIALDGEQYRDEITVTVAEGSAESTDTATQANNEPSVFFTSPTDGAEVTSPFEVEMGATGLSVDPAGDIKENSGHMHILVDEDFVAPGEVILASDTMLHYGDGQTKTTLDLPPGEHTLRLQFANGAHIALEGDQYRDEITITVK